MQNSGLPKNYKIDYESAMPMYLLNDRLHWLSSINNNKVLQDEEAYISDVDETPEELAPALADAYLALKAAGRL